MTLGALHPETHDHSEHLSVYILTFWNMFSSASYREYFILGHNFHRGRGKLSADM